MYYQEITLITLWIILSNLPLCTNLPTTQVDHILGGRPLQVDHRFDLTFSLGARESLKLNWNPNKYKCNSPVLNVNLIYSTPTLYVKLLYTRTNSCSLFFAMKFFNYKKPRFILFSELSCCVLVHLNIQLSNCLVH